MNFDKMAEKVAACAVAEAESVVWRAFAPAVKIKSPLCECLVSIHGGHVLEFKPSGHAPVLWNSSHGHDQLGKAIRGGIPVCWPWFGAHPEDSSKPSHGFARISGWELDDIETLPTGIIRLRMSLPPNGDGLELVEVVEAGETLSVELISRNNGSGGVLISQALHSYFNISDIETIQISGLDGIEYVDSLDGDKIKRQTGAVEFGSELDRIYIGAPGDCVIHDPGLGRRVRIAKSGSNSTVVWNPWIEKSARMTDFGDEEYRGMVCVETTNAWNDARTLPPGATLAMRTEIGLE